MPLLNDRGDVIAGAGGTQGSLNRMPYPFATFGGGSWLDDSTVLLQEPRPAPTLGELGTWRSGDAAPIGWGMAANDWASRAGAWAAWLPGRGVFGTLEERLPPSLRAGLAKAGTLGPRAVAPDGTIAYVPDRQAGLGVRLVDPAGGIVDVPGVVAYSFQALGPGTAIWKGGAVGRAPVRPAAADAQGVILVTLSDGDWLAYWSESCGFIAQRDGDADGYVLGREPLFFNHDARAVDGELAIAWSVTQGEAPGDVHVAFIDRNAPRVPIAPSAPSIPAFSFSHSVSTVPFKDPLGDSGAQAEVLVNQNAQRQARPLFVADDSLIDGNWTGPLLGVYTEYGPGDPDVSKAIKGAAALKTRLLACYDSRDPWFLPAGLRAWDVPAVECYRYPGETLEEAVARWRRDVAAMAAQWPGDMAVVGMWYCMGGAAGGDPPEVWPVGDVLDAQRPLNEIVNSCLRIRMILPFSYLRANGITAHPELMASFRNLLAAAPGAPILTPVPPDKPIDPPKPKPETFTHRGVKMASIDGKTVVLRGPKGMLMRPDAPGTGIWKDADPKGTWRGSKFDVVDKNDPRAHYVAKKLSNGRYTYTNVQDRCLVGIDGGWYTPDVLAQFYHKPTDNTDAGDLEQLRTYDGNENGAIEAQTEQVTDDQHPAGAGQKFFAYPLAVEVV